MSLSNHDAFTPASLRAGVFSGILFTQMVNALIYRKEVTVSFRPLPKLAGRWMLSTLLVATLLLCNAALCHLMDQGAASTDPLLPAHSQTSGPGSVDVHPDSVGYAAAFFVALFGALLAMLDGRAHKPTYRLLCFLNGTSLPKVLYISPGPIQPLTQVFRL